MDGGIPPRSPRVCSCVGGLKLLPYAGFGGCWSSVRQPRAVSGQDCFASGDAGAMVVKLQSPPHDADRIAQRLDVAAGIMPLVSRGAESESLHEPVQRMAGSGGGAKEPPGNGDGVNGFDRSPLRLVLMAGGLQELGVEAVAIVGHDHRVADEPGEPLQHFDGARSIADVPIRDAGVVRNEARDGAGWPAIAEERIASDDRAILKTRGGDLDDFAALWTKPGGFQVEDHK